MKSGDTVTVEVYGRKVQAIVLEVHPFGTIDIEVVATGKCFRLSGLAMEHKV